ncbi:right-handed parallel beta-helix repeat-containing protein [Halomicrobium urmianum]|uniref:right-handed parallel beta-helix repeat-containing protein n=1 Tax=Halomicrobium urmianum TaxID=1586233 RepID=UPI001CD93732|nr:right-handed parallel beta-helix repeat-containing protein [Halomicrobium urmianum]
MLSNSDEENVADGSTRSGNARFGRREVLHGISTTVLGGVLLGGTASAETTTDRIDRYFEEFGTVVDIVEAGADDTGRESVVDVIREYRADDTLLVFPPGEYYMDEQVRFSGFENFGLVGNDATLIPADYYDFAGPQYRLFRLGVPYNPGNRLVFDGFDVDQTSPDTGIRVIETVVDDGLEVRNVTVHGEHDSGTWGPGSFAVSDPAGTGLVEAFEVPDGGAWEDETPNEGNIWRGPTGLLANSNSGTLTFRDCVVGAFPDNGLYASGGDGTIRVEGGHFSNSNAACLRIGGDGSSIRGATVVVDQNRPRDESHRGIRLERGGDIEVRDVTVRNTAPLPNSFGISVMNSCTSAWIENADVTISGDEVTNGIVTSPNCGEVVVLESRVEMHTPGGFGIEINDGDNTGRVLCEYVDFVGSVGDETAKAAVRNDRDETRLGAVTVDQSGGSQRRAVVNTGDDVTIFKGEYRASELPIIDIGDGTHVEEIYAESYGDEEAYSLYPDSANVYLKRNTLRGGIKDHGCDGLETLGNEF